MSRRRISPWLGFLVGGLLPALLPSPARAHQAGLSYGTWTARGDDLALDLRVRADDLATLLPEGAPSADAASLARAFLAGVQVSRGAACPARAGTAHRVPPDGLELTATFRCPESSGPFEVRLPVLGRLPPGHVHLARVEANGGVEERVADARSPAFEVAAPPALLRRAARFVALGLEHILSGWDHLAFLLGLLLAAARLGDVLRSLTAFTAAHALTLALGVLGLANPPRAVIEPLIAASVVVVAVWNLVDLHRGRSPGGAARPPRAAGRPRWPIALVFGLVHGFGFAGALGELRLTGGALAIALGSFNFGVELGQAAVALAVFPALRWLRSAPRAAVPGLSAGSTAVAAAGLLWLAERLAW